MDKEQIFEMAIRELTENALEIRRENLPEAELELYSQIENLSKKVQGILNGLSEEERNAIESYIDQKEYAADKECLFLYLQGAKDVIVLLKKLGVL